MSARSCVVAALALASFTAAPAAAQVRFTAVGTAAQPFSSIRFQGNKERLSGLWYGGSVTLQAYWFSATAEGSWGPLEPIEQTVSLDRNAGEVRGLASLALVPGVGVEVGYGVRRFLSDAGTQEWRILRTGVSVGGDLGSPAIRSRVAVAYLPLTEVLGMENPYLGLLAEAELVIALRRAGPALQARYRIERYDFKGGANARLEQFESLTVGIGFHVDFVQRP